MRKAAPQLNCYDYVIIGSGFGGSVAALRLSEKGYKVLVVEKGKWYHQHDFPKTNWNLRKWLWLPSVGFFGIMKMTFFKHIGILSGVGVGGGSLVYANTLPRPKPTFYQTGSWAKLANWEQELRPFYDKALHMLGAAKNPYKEIADNTLEQMAILEGRADKFELTDVSIFFGESDVVVPDPYFKGEGPERAGCNSCGACMTGCRHNAKNTLDKNYLHLAQKKGAEIIAQQEVIDVLPINGEEEGLMYLVRFRSSKPYSFSTQSVKAKGIVFAGGVLGTVKLLLKLKKKSLPHLSDHIGKEVRSNNESLIMTVCTDKTKDFTKGISIGSIYEVDQHTHLEPVRYGQGSGFWRLGLTPAVSSGSFFKRGFQAAKKILRHPFTYFNILTVADFAKQSVVLLFMQQIDSTLRFKRGWFRMKTSITSGNNPKAYIPLALQLAEKYGKIAGAKPMVYFTESVFNIPSTAHILGGAVMGENKENGVVDSENRVFGYENMYICDGSVISANPGVNPSLSITAIAERAMSKIRKIK